MWNSVDYYIYGRGHEINGTPCQDRTACLKKNSVYCMALADGAGSAPLSHFGADCVVHSITEYLTDNFDSLINNEDGVAVKSEIVGLLLQKLEKVCEIKNCTLTDLASTLLFCAVKEGKFMIGHIGDGVIGYVKQGELRIASKPDNGEYVNSTFFVTSYAADNHLKLIKGCTDGIEGFVLMSDGSAESFYDRAKSSLSPALHKLIQWTTVLSASKMAELVKQSFDTLIRNHTQDDCSIAVLAQKCSDLESLGYREKCSMFGLVPLESGNKKKMRRYFCFIKTWKQNDSIKKIAHQVHLRYKYAQRKLIWLLSIGMIERRYTNRGHDRIRNL